MRNSGEVFASWLLCVVVAVLAPVVWLISVVWEFFGWVFSGFRKWGG